MEQDAGPRNPGSRVAGSQGDVGGGVGMLFQGRTKEVRGCLVLRAAVRTHFDCSGLYTPDEYQLYLCHILSVYYQSLPLECKLYECKEFCLLRSLMYHQHLEKFVVHRKPRFLLLLDK